MTLQDEAVAMMKHGSPPGAVYARLVAQGMTDNEARALVDGLVALKQQAAALDPKRLREEAIWMFWNGATADDVVRHFVTVGVAEEHARPEVDRILVAVSKMT